MKKIAVVCVLAGILSGCAGAGNQCLRHETETTVGHKIVEGVSTKSDVKAMFGAPDDVTFSGNAAYETWSYEFANLKADGVNYIPFVNLFGSSVSGTKKKLVVLFDGCGLVKRYAMSEAATVVKTGLFNR